MKSYIYTMVGEKITVYRVKHNIPKLLSATTLSHRTEMQAVTALITVAENLRFSDEEGEELKDRFNSWLGNRSWVSFKSGFTQSVAAYRLEKGRIQIHRVI